MLVRIKLFDDARSHLLQERWPDPADIPYAGGSLGTRTSRPHSRIRLFEYAGWRHMSPLRRLGTSMFKRSFASGTTNPPYVLHRSAFF